MYQYGLNNDSNCTTLEVTEQSRASQRSATQLQRPRRAAVGKGVLQRLPVLTATPQPPLLLYLPRPYTQLPPHHPPGHSSQTWTHPRLFLLTQGWYLHHPLSEQLLKFCALGTSPTSPQTPSLSPPHSSPVFHTLPMSGQLLNTIKSVFLVWLTSFPPFHPHDACCLHCDPHLDRCHEPPLPSISTLRPGGDTENASPANYLMGLHSLQDKPQVCSTVLSALGSRTC